MDDLQYGTLFVNLGDSYSHSFKPCYKWMTFNTKQKRKEITLH